MITQKKIQNKNLKDINHKKEKSSNDLIKLDVDHKKINKKLNRQDISNETKVKTKKSFQELKNIKEEKNQKEIQENDYFIRACRENETLLLKKNYIEKNKLCIQNCSKLFKEYVEKEKKDYNKRKKINNLIQITRKHTEFFFSKFKSVQIAIYKNKKLQQNIRKKKYEIDCLIIFNQEKTKKYLNLTD